jgi:VWFA-related protein
MRKASAVLFLLAALGSSASAFAQPGVPQSTEPAVPGPLSGPIVRGWPSVNLNVVVLDRKNNQVEQADGAGFQLFEDGKPQTIQSVAGANTPVSLCLLIDESGSTHFVRREIREAATALVKGLPPGSEVAAIGFADEAHLDLPLAPAASADLSFLTRLEGRGGTTLYDSLVVAESYLASHAQNKRRAIAVISDGGENASKTSLDATEKCLMSPGAPALYALLYRNEPAEYGELRSAVKRANKLLGAAGGAVFEARKAADMARVADGIAAAIRSQSALTFTTTGQARDGRLHKLEVKVAQPAKGMEIHAPSGYYAPTN